jgi:catalase
MDGLTTLQSSFTPEETTNRFEAEVKARGMTVFARINHAALAQQAGLALRPTELVLFGNPRGGTPLMQANQTIGIDLPLKALVWQDPAGKTWLSYNEPAWLAKRHGIPEREPALSAMSLALNGIAAKATTSSEPGHDDQQHGPATDTKAPEPTGSVTKGDISTANKSAHVAQTSIEPPRTISIPRLIAIGLVIGGIAGLFAYAGGWLTPHALSPARITDTFQQVNGLHPGFRRNHAKGVCVSGFFLSNGQGVSLSKASVFRPGRVRIIGRFSLSGGRPYAADAATAVRGLAIRFQPTEGEEWRTAMINLPVFPVRTPQAFNEQLLASAPDAATGKPDPAKMQAFLAEHPESAAALQAIQRHPRSSGFENSTFNSLNAFRFINASGAVSWVRWSLAPVQPFEPLSAVGAKETGTNYLFDALIESIHRQPQQWQLVLTVAQTGDPTDDATLAWASDRVQIDVGTLIVDRVESDDTSPARDINFDPLVLPEGIAASDDPLLSARSAVYSQSFTRREGELKHASAVSPTETRE